MTPEKAKEILKLLAEENVIISEERQQQVLDRVSYRTTKHNEQNRAWKRERMEDPEYRAQRNAYARAWQRKLREDPEYRAQFNAKRRARERKLKEDPEYRAKINAYQRAWAQRKKKEKKENE